MQLFIFPQTEQDHVQIVLEKLIPCPDLLGDKFLVFDTKKRHNTKVNKYDQLKATQIHIKTI